VSPGSLTENGAGAMTAARTKPADPGGLRAFGQLSRSARLLGKRARPRIDFSDLRIRGRTLRRQRRTDRRRELQFFIGMSVAQDFDLCLNARITGGEPRFTAQLGAASEALLGVARAIPII